VRPEDHFFKIPFMAKARAGRLAPGDMSGGTFTISSLGGISGTSFR
jgi:pyruvate/2-oxoglutarate dehydrogenase complex dihydrolipoamide acyltransferase (E2) component